MQNKSIIVTGGGSGIGAATVLLAASKGANVTIADLNRSAGEAVRDQVIAQGGKAQFVETNIADEAQVQAMVEAAVGTYGRLDGAFNNAAIPAYSHQPGVETVHFAELPVSAFIRSMTVNVVGTFLCMKYELQAMLVGGGGSIVNTSSMAGILAVEAAADYVAAKHAVIGLTKTAALDYARKNIRVNAVLPGVVRTQMMEASFAENPELIEWTNSMQPIGRVGMPVELAEAAVWLLSDAASLVTGISMPVDGGFSMV